MKRNTRSLKIHHSRCLEILDAIQEFERRKRTKLYNIETLGDGWFPELRGKWLNDIDTIERCINRMYQRYDRLNETD